MGKSFSIRFHSSFCRASDFCRDLRDSSMVCCQVPFFTYRIRMSRWLSASALDGSTILANITNTVSRNTLFVLFCPLLIFDSTLKGRNNMFTPFSFLSLPELLSFVVIIAESVGQFKRFLRTSNWCFYSRPVRKMRLICICWQKDRESSGYLPRNYK